MQIHDSDSQFFGYSRSTTVGRFKVQEISLFMHFLDGGYCSKSRSDRNNSFGFRWLVNQWELSIASAGSVPETSASKLSQLFIYEQEVIC